MTFRSPCPNLDLFVGLRIASRPSCLVQAQMEAMEQANAARALGVPTFRVAGGRPFVGRMTFRLISEVHML